MNNTATHWQEAIDYILDNEGSSLSNDPDDTGGMSKFGISQKSYPHLDIVHLTLDQAKEIYFRDFWFPSQAYNIDNQQVAIKYFDIAINAGLSHAVNALQDVVNFFRPSSLVADKKIGPRTIDAVNQCRGNVLQALCGYQWMMYYMIVSAHPHLAKFSHGWSLRAFRVS